jgi:hypothetical protein
MIEDLIKRAAQQEQKLAKKRNSLRFKKVLGRLLRMKLLRTTENIMPNSEKMDIKDLLWAAGIEPRINELIPAIAVKKPSAIVGLERAPADLKKVIKEIRSSNAKTPFRTATARDYMQWLSHVGQRKKSPTLLKSFRFQREDLELLHFFTESGMSEIEAVRRGLRLLKKH